MPHAPLRWFHHPDEWDGMLPAAFALVASPSTRGLFPDLVARALRCEASAVAIAHPSEGPPRIVRPEGAGLVLSSSRREGYAALAIAAGPVGVDVEAVEPAGEIPWRVLHPAEAADLARLPAEKRARDFARLWSLKEAYVKALGTGFGRDPARFAVRFLDEDRAEIEDPDAAPRPAVASTHWPAGAGAAFACVLLQPGGGDAGERTLRRSGPPSKMGSRN